MDSLWKNLPTEIIHKIIQLTGKVVYRDNRYIDINKLKGDYAIIEHIYKKQLTFDTSVSNDGSWYLEFRFDKFIYDPRTIRHHGLCFSYRYDYRDKFEVCYWNNRYPEPHEEGTAWIQQRTYFELPPSKNFLEFR